MSKIPPREPSPLSRAIVVGWVISTLTAAMSELVALTLVACDYFFTLTDPLRALTVLVAFTALFSGILGLIFLPFAVRVAEVDIPRVMIAGALFLCSIPPLFFAAALFG